MIGRLPLRWQIMLAFGSVAAVSMMSLIGSLEAVHGRNAATRPMLPGYEVAQLGLGLVVGSIISLGAIIGAAAFLRSGIGGELTRMHEAASAISEGRLDHRHQFRASRRAW